MVVLLRGCYLCLFAGEDSADLVIGCPTRFPGGARGMSAAFLSNPFLTVSSIAMTMTNLVMDGFAKTDIEDKIQANRLARSKLDKSNI